MLDGLLQPLIIPEILHKLLIHFELPADCQWPVGTWQWQANLKLLLKPSAEAQAQNICVWHLPQNLDCHGQQPQEFESRMSW